MRHTLLVLLRDAVALGWKLLLVWLLARLLLVLWLHWER